MFIRKISSIRWKYSHYAKTKNINILFELVTLTIFVEYLPADEFCEDKHSYKQSAA